MNFNLDWDLFIIDSKVPSENTKSNLSSRTSELVRKIWSQNQSIPYTYIAADVRNGDGFGERV